MKAEDIRKTAFAVPHHIPSYPLGPYRFVDREYMIITYRTDREALQRVVPAPLEIEGDPIVKYEFIRMPNRTGFGDYTESGQVVPVRLHGQAGGYVHAMDVAAGHQVVKKAKSPSAIRRRISRPRVQTPGFASFDSSTSRSANSR
jgi:acetoacetate decarboxylase